MHRHYRTLASLSVLSLLWVANVGCSAFASSYARPLHVAMLDETGKVELWEYAQHNAVLRGPEHNFRVLSLHVALPGDELVKGVICRKGGEHGKDAPGYEFGELEARTDETGRKVWIMDKDTGRVIASADCDTQVLTGPDDEAPLWANRGAGTVLEPAPVE